MQFTDSHCHLQDDKIKNAQQIIKELKNEGFVRVVCASSNPEDWEKVAEIAIENPDFVIPAFGLHPWHIKEAEKNWLETLEKMLVLFPKAQIGECGLDRLKAPEWEAQEEIFLAQIELARRFNRSLNIHALKAENEFQPLWKKLSQKFMIHSFGGSLNILKKALDSGGYISVSANLLNRRNAQEIIQKIPFERLLTETDAPYQTNFSDIKRIIAEIAERKSISKEKLSEIILQNFNEFNQENKNQF